MKAVSSLPDGYKEIFKVNLQKDKKIAMAINIWAIAVAVLLAVPGHLYVPVTTLFNMDDGLGAYTLRFVCMLVSIIAYLILHELIHGITMKFFGTQKVNYGFTGLYAFAGSDDYYCKKSYIIIALAPIVVLGIVIAIINALVPKEWFWVVYFVQLSNISGAAGDIYVTAKFSKMPNDILVQDSGVGMTVYSKKIQP